MDVKQIRDILCTNKEISAFITNNSITDDELIMNITNFFNYKESLEVCKNCDGLHCLSSAPYMKSNLSINPLRRVSLNYIDCKYSKSDLLGNLEVISYNDENTDFIASKNRDQIFDLLGTFRENYKKGIRGKGLYIYGKCGVGKSFILYNFAKSLVNDGAKVLFAYYPDLVRELQSSIGTPKLESLILKLKKADILMLDDIGREANTQYIRDEVFGPILQYRENNNLPMFMTSNRDLNLIEKHLSDANNTLDAVKARALVERLKKLMIDVELIDKDYRNN